MNKFFKIKFPDGKYIVIVSKNGYAGLLDLFKDIEDKDHTYIIPLTLFQFIKYIMFEDGGKMNV